ncbi:hypothetical protein CGMCC3_g5845 [Colletotrichum fructicola]|uniref:Itaconate transport protein n=1 Tax=Colletotrichum fructicola (strain Nara gc5) TaxID=1213859 RepID=A0A7J6JJS2_COLFN|nr:uncharacterized protein CGMCC3_g5845 [Colletotrichum fructicola]KAE9578225.1 hypothetical protein CGMCC3_g5845 [Colletotrichum fructicola]KAF4489865.1 Itaconate transport protein [Colletotrichum fructicola Nara gc5]KAF5504053.1 Itaconate transport protein [Colletotrichum fructicola]
MAAAGSASPRTLQQGIRRSISAAASGGLHLLTSETDLNQGREHDEHISPTRVSVRDRMSLQSRSPGSSSLSDLDPFFDRAMSLPSIRERDSDNDSQFRNPFADTNSVADTQADDARNPFDDSSAEDTLQEQPLEPPYHIFTKRQKWFVIVIIGTAGLFSGLSSNIYFPSLDAISRDLHVSAEMVSLTITSYLIIQGISPLFWGSISDALGRRPIYIASFAVYIISNIGLSFSPNFTILMVFRGLQAAGSASTVSIGNGVIQDISPPAERGEFISFYQAITIVIIIFLPETMRSIAGNGSLRLGGVYKPLIRLVTKEPDYLEDPEEPLPRKKVTAATFLEPLRLLVQRDILINLIFGGVVYTIWSMVTSSTTGLFKQLFNLNELQIGLAFLPNGFGTIVGSAIAGKLMTRDYKAIEEAYKASHNMEKSEKLTAKNMPADFPIERARLRRLPWVVVIFIASTGAYGVSLNFPAATSLTGWIAVPLTLQFFIAATSNAVFALNQTLVTDLCPGKGASATAINNLVRCGLGAIGVAFIEQFIASTGPGAAFLGLALVMVVVGPLAVVHWYWGQQWRAARIQAKEMTETEKEAGRSG